MKEFSCPRCGRSVDSQARYCQHCGVDLAIAAVLAEQKVTSSTGPLIGAPLTPEVLVPRLGTYLMEKGVLDSDGLDQALAYQDQKSLAGKSILLGQALVELGLVDRETIDQAITMQIMQLQSALQQANRQLEARVKERTIELEKAVDKLKELNQLKANFLANISHELRTPLSHLRGFLDLIADGSLGPLAPAQVSAVGVMVRAEARLENLIEDLIQFGLAARGELYITLDEVDIIELVHTVTEQARKKAEQKSIVLETPVSEALLLVSCDQEKIGWVIAQVLDNAIKFTPPGGSVQIESIQQNGVVTVSIRDTGIGIPEERLEEIFEPFHQLDGSSTRRYGGTGLGLALSNRILAAHDSPVTVTSKVGEGTRFAFSLPVSGTPSGKEEP